jgi:protein TIF31
MKKRKLHLKRKSKVNIYKIIVLIFLIIEEIEKKRKLQIEKIQEFDKYLKEAPQFKYNLNIHTKAKTADEDAEKDEELVDHLSTFVIDHVIPKLIKAYESGENVPLDNESLTKSFHSQGLNMRYLGKVYEKIGEEKLPHIRILLERSMVCRGAKKIYNELLQQCPSVHTSKFIAHILNILLAPESIISKLNEGKLKEEILLDEEQPILQAEEEKAEDAPKAGKSKKNKKKKKDKGKDAKEEEEAKTKKIFELNSLFNREFTNFVHEKEKDESLLNITPNDFYERIKKYVLHRYNHVLPESVVHLKCLSTKRNKIAFLRDFCLMIGVKINCRDYHLVDEEGKEQEDTLPFTENDIVELIPLIKHIDITNID